MQTENEILCKPTFTILKNKWRVSCAISRNRGKEFLGYVKGAKEGVSLEKQSKVFTLAKNVKGDPRFQFTSRQIDFLLAQCSF